MKITKIRIQSVLIVILKLTLILAWLAGMLIGDRGAPRI